MTARHLVPLFGQVVSLFGVVSSPSADEKEFLIVTPQQD